MPLTWSSKSSKNNELDTVHAIASDCKTALDGLMLETRGGLQYEKVGSSFWVQIKDSGLTYGVDDETSPFLAVKVSFKVHSKK